MRIAHLGAGLTVLLAACGGSVSPSELDSSSSGTGSSSSSNATQSSSSSAPTGSSSSTDGSSSSFSALPDVDSTLVEGPSDLSVSMYADSNTLVLTWTDVPSFKRDEYLGYKIYRSKNYSGWVEIGTAEPLQQFYKDNSIDTLQYKYLYRIAAYDTTASGTDTLISKYSNQAGTVALSTLGFGSVVFDSPGDIKIVRWAPSKYELLWTHSGLKPEAGFVPQYMNCENNTQVPYYQDTSLTTTMDCVGDWLNLDTLGESDNHIYVYGSNAYGAYRVYAYYDDEFGSVISEYTAEKTTTGAAYDPSIVFTAPVAYSTVLDTATISVNWAPTHNAAVETANDGTNSVDTVWYRFQEWVGGAPVVEQVVATDEILHMVKNIPKGDLCAYMFRVRVEWIDQWGEKDVTPWSAATGTVSGAVNLKDRGKLCSE